MTTLLDTNRDSSDRRYLAAGRAVSGIAATMGLAGMGYFLLIAEDRNPVTPWLDNTLVAVKVIVCTGLLAVALAPRLSAGLRRRVGMAAVALDLGFSLIKATTYGEAGALVFVVVDALIALLLLRGARDDLG
jgi:hypothetical protein